VTTNTVAIGTPGNNTILNASVGCPGSTHAVGGGSSFATAPTTSQQVALQESNPTGSPPTGWHVRYQQMAAGGGAGGTNWSVIVSVICS
jgi:hypothetical protein